MGWMEHSSWWMERSAEIGKGHSHSDTSVRFVCGWVQRGDVRAEEWMPSQPRRRSADIVL